LIQSRRRRAKAPTPNAEPLSLELAAQIRAAHALLVTADDLGDFERRQELAG
jgi:hypothetical protein